MKIKINDQAPNFILSDHEGRQHQLNDYKNKWLLVYFYPRDNTPGCTKEACQIRDNYSAFNKIGLSVLGVSTDSIKSHQNFVKKYNLPFPLLADTDKIMVNDYGVYGTKKMMGKIFTGVKRKSFLINPSGKIVKIYDKVKPVEHAQEVLDDYKKLI